jgi:hypothetical protein
MIAVELFAKPKPNDRHWYAYDVLLDGEIIVFDSRDPEHDLARALLARRIKGIVAVRDGRTGTLRSKVNIESVSKKGIGSNLDRYDWKPSEIGKDSPYAGVAVPLGAQVGEAA